MDAVQKEARARVERAAAGFVREVLAAFDDVLTGHPAQLRIRKIGEGTRFSFPFPDAVESYPTFSVWVAEHPAGRVDLRVAWTTRPAFGRKRRKRSVVFGPPSTAAPGWYPWVEFTETDDGRMSSVVPDPKRPRRQLRDGDSLPAHYKGRTVERSDALFGSIREGPSLRLVVTPDDEDGMVDHGFYVAQLKGRV